LKLLKGVLETHSGAFSGIVELFLELPHEKKTKKLVSKTIYLSIILQG
jgi:hypothetical protein